MLVSDFQSITHRDDLGNDLAEIYRMLSGEILTCQLEKRFIHKLGHDVWASSSASLVRDAQGEPLHFIFQIQDITERKRAEAAIQTLSLADELTGLYNRRGFLAFCEQHLNSLQRTNKGVVHGLCRSRWLEKDQRLVWSQGRRPRADQDCGAVERNVPLVRRAWPSRRR